MSSLLEADSLLVVDVGSVNTRALLFDVVDGRYRFLGAGASPTTAGAPFHDVSEGVRLALEQLQTVSGRTLMDANDQLVMPGSSDGTGIDTFAATISAGPPLKVLVVGLLDDVSVESARRLAMTTYSGLLETLSLNDRRRPEARLSAILRLRPELVIVGGGTEGGASQSVLQLLESIGLASYLTPESLRPALLFAGNSELQEEVKSTLGSLANVHFAPNVRPALETERLDPAQTALAGLYREIRARQIQGVRSLNEWAGGGLLPTASAFGRTVRFISKAHNSPKGVLGVDVGASATTLAAAYQGELTLGVYPQLGLGAPARDLLDHISESELARWLAVDVSEASLREYLYNKSLYPASIPASKDELAIEQALARSVLRAAVKRTAPGLSHLPSSGAGLLPWFEPVIATGSVLTRAPSLAQAMMILLDGLQPTGATTVILDQNHIVSALGAAAAVNPMALIQVVDTNALTLLGTVIAPISNARPGTPIIRLKMGYEDGAETTHETTLDVKQGSLEVLPLGPGQSAKLQLQPLHRADMGMGSPGRRENLRVYGGALGVVIDARGRPLQLPEDSARRQELFRKWLWTLGG